METKGFVLYLLAALSLAAFSVHLIDHLLSNGDRITQPYLHTFSDSAVLKQSVGGEEKVWPELEFNWRIVFATVVAFVGSAFGTVGGVGGGGLFLPTLTLIVGFDTKSAAALSKCMIMGATVSSAWYNLTVQHPCRQVPIVDYDLALLFQPMLMLGITTGVPLSVIFPYWLITVLIIVLFMATSSRSFIKAIAMWKEETTLKLKNAASYEPLLPLPEKSPWESLKCNLDVKRFSMLFIEWICFISIQVIKKQTEVCSSLYWGLTFIQLPIAVSVLGYECMKIYKENKRRKLQGNEELICEATIEWNITNIILCALCGLLGGTVGGLLGSGAGFIIGPFLLEIGLLPQVASATATFSMMFSVTLSVTEFYLLNRFPMGFAVYMMLISMLAGFGGQLLIKKLVDILGRASIIVFILSGVILASAVTMGVIGIVKSIGTMDRGEFMGFLDYCTNQ